MDMGKGLKYGTANGKYYGINMETAVNPKNSDEFNAKLSDAGFLDNIEKNIIADPEFTVLLIPESRSEFDKSSLPAIKALIKKYPGKIDVASYNEYRGMEANYIVAEFPQDDFDIKNKMFTYLQIIKKDLNTIATRGFDFVHIINKSNAVIIPNDARPVRMGDDQVITYKDTSDKKKVRELYLNLLEDVEDRTAVKNLGVIGVGTETAPKIDVAFGGYANIISNYFKSDIRDKEGTFNADVFKELYFSVNDDVKKIMSDVLEDFTLKASTGEDIDPEFFNTAIVELEKHLSESVITSFVYMKDTINALHGEDVSRRTFFKAYLDKSFSAIKSELESGEVQNDIIFTDILFESSTVTYGDFMSSVSSEIENIKEETNLDPLMLAQLSAISDGILESTTELFSDLVNTVIKKAEDDVGIRLDVNLLSDEHRDILYKSTEDSLRAMLLSLDSGELDVVLPDLDINNQEDSKDLVNILSALSSFEIQRVAAVVKSIKSINPDDTSYELDEGIADMFHKLTTEYSLDSVLEAVVIEAEKIISVKKKVLIEDSSLGKQRKRFEQLKSTLGVSTTAITGPALLDEFIRINSEMQALFEASLVGGPEFTQQEKAGQIEEFSILLEDMYNIRVKLSVKTNYDKLGKRFFYTRTDEGDTYQQYVERADDPELKNEIHTIGLATHIFYTEQEIVDLHRKRTAWEDGDRKKPFYGDMNAKAGDLKQDKPVTQFLSHKGYKPLTAEEATPLFSMSGSVKSPLPGRVFLLAVKQTTSKGIVHPNIFVAVEKDEKVYIVSQLQSDSTNEAVTDLVKQVSDIFTTGGIKTEFVHPGSNNSFASFEIPLDSVTQNLLYRPGKINTTEGTDFKTIADLRKEGRFSIGKNGFFITDPESNNKGDSFVLLSPNTHVDLDDTLVLEQLFDSRELKKGYAPKTADIMPVNTAVVPFKIQPPILVMRDFIKEFNTTFNVINTLASSVLLTEIVTAAKLLPQYTGGDKSKPKNAVFIDYINELAGYLITEVEGKKENVEGVIKTLRDEQGKASNDKMDAFFKSISQAILTEFIDGSDNISFIRQVKNSGEKDTYIFNVPGFAVGGYLIMRDAFISSGYDVLMDGILKASNFSLSLPSVEESIKGSSDVGLGSPVVMEELEEYLVTNISSIDAPLLALDASAKSKIYSELKKKVVGEEPEVTEKVEKTSNFTVKEISYLDTIESISGLDDFSIVNTFIPVDADEINSLQKIVVDRISKLESLEKRIELSNEGDIKNRYLSHVQAVIKALHNTIIVSEILKSNDINLFTDDMISASHRSLFNDLVPVLDGETDATVEILHQLSFVDEEVFSLDTDEKVAMLLESIEEVAQLLPTEVLEDIENVFKKC